MDSRILENRDKILQLAAMYRASNVRIFGSQARREVNENSDIEICS
jgi:predicted nucleotidyltransferase